MNAREVIARTTGMCIYSTNGGSAHDHAGCLAEADGLIESLRLAGYQVLGVAVIDDIAKAVGEIEEYSKDLTWELGEVLIPRDVAVARVNECGGGS